MSLIYMKLRDRLKVQGFTCIEEREEGTIFNRDGYDKKIIVKESKDCRLRYSDEVRLFELWRLEELHPFIALKNGKFFDMLFNEVVSII